jgi:hypothetical protein
MFERVPFHLQNVPLPDAAATSSSRSAAGPVVHVGDPYRERTRARSVELMSRLVRASGTIALKPIPMITARSGCSLEVGAITNLGSDVRNYEVM